MKKKARCYYCGRTDDVPAGSQPGDFLACPHCDTVGVWDANAGASLEMSSQDRAVFLEQYPVISNN